MYTVLVARTDRVTRQLGPWVVNADIKSPIRASLVDLMYLSYQRTLQFQDAFTRCIHSFGFSHPFCRH